MNKIIKIENENYKVFMMDSLFIYLKNINNKFERIEMRSKFIKI